EAPSATGPQDRDSVGSAPRLAPNPVYVELEPVPAMPPPKKPAVKKKAKPATAQAHPAPAPAAEPAPATTAAVPPMAPPRTAAPGPVAGRAGPGERRPRPCCGGASPRAAALDALADIRQNSHIPQGRGTRPPAGAVQGLGGWREAVREKAAE